MGSIPSITKTLNPQDPLDSLTLETIKTTTALFNTRFTAFEIQMSNIDHQYQGVSLLNLIPPTKFIGINTAFNQNRFQDEIQNFVDKLVSGNKRQSVQNLLLHRFNQILNGFPARYGQSIGSLGVINHGGVMLRIVYIVMQQKVQKVMNYVCSDLIGYYLHVKVMDKTKASDHMGQYLDCIRTQFPSSTLDQHYFILNRLLAKSIYSNPQGMNQRLEYHDRHRFYKSYFSIGSLSVWDREGSKAGLEFAKEVKERLPIDTVYPYGSRPIDYKIKISKQRTAYFFLKSAIFRKGSLRYTIYPPPITRQLLLVETFRPLSTTKKVNGAQPDIKMHAKQQRWASFSPSHNSPNNPLQIYKVLTSFLQQFFNRQQTTMGAFHQFYPHNDIDESVIEIATTAHNHMTYFRLQYYSHMNIRFPIGQYQKIPVEKEEYAGQNTYVNISLNEDIINEVIKDFVNKFIHPQLRYSIFKRLQAQIEVARKSFTNDYTESHHHIEFVRPKDLKLVRINFLVMHHPFSSMVVRKYYQDMLSVAWMITTLDKSSLIDDNSYRVIIDHHHQHLSLKQRLQLLQSVKKSDNHQKSFQYSSEDPKPKQNKFPFQKILFCKKKAGHEEVKQQSSCARL